MPCVTKSMSRSLDVFLDAIHGLAGSIPPEVGPARAAGQLLAAQFCWEPYSEPRLGVVLAASEFHASNHGLLMWFKALPPPPPTQANDVLPLFAESVAGSCGVIDSTPCRYPDRQFWCAFSVHPSSKTYESSLEILVETHPAVK